MGNVIAIAQHARQQQSSDSGSDVDSVTDPMEHASEEHAEDLFMEYVVQHEGQPFEQEGEAEGAAARLPCGPPRAAFVALLQCGRRPEWEALLGAYLASALYAPRAPRAAAPLTKGEAAGVIRPMLRELDVFARACAAFIEEKRNAPGAAHIAHFFAATAAYDVLVGDGDARAHAALAAFGRYAFRRLAGEEAMGELAARGLRQLPGTPQSVKDAAAGGAPEDVARARALQLEECKLRRGRQ